VSSDHRWQILQLLYQAAEAVDGPDRDAFAELFAKGSFTAGGTTMHGSEEIRRSSERNLILYEGLPRTNHFVQNPIIEIDGDGRHARARSYVQALQAVPGSLPLQTIATGTYDDTFERDEDGWHFKTRVAHVSLIGDVSAHTRMDVARD
jgi:hypothetical protein